MMFWKTPTAPVTAQNPIEVVRDHIDAGLVRQRAELEECATRIADAKLYAEEVAAMENTRMEALLASIRSAEIASVALTSIASL
jgi:hypothetical protein